MAVTKTVHVSYGSKLGNSIKGVAGGLLAFVVAFPLLFWNEGRTVKQTRALEEGQGKTVEGDYANLDGSLEGQLVHISGKADTQDVLTDDIFGVSLTGIRLSRKVEMYQWVEHEHRQEKENVGGSSDITYTYTYSKEWSSLPIDSSKFQEAGHANPGAFPVQSEKWIAKTVTFGANGARLLSEGQIGRIGGDAVYATTNAPKSATIGEYAVTAREGGYYLSKTVEGATGPQIGDVRVKFSATFPHVISVIAVQSGSTFKAYKAKNGNTISLLSDGEASIEEMYSAAHAANNMLAWLIRLAGFCLMFFGLKTVFKPLATLGAVLPFLGKVLGAGISVVAFLIAAPCTLVTIAIAWLFYRPVLGIGLLAVSAVLIWKLKQMKAKAAQAKTAEAPAAAPAQ